MLSCLLQDQLCNDFYLFLFDMHAATSLLVPVKKFALHLQFNGLEHSRS